MSLTYFFLFFLMLNEPYDSQKVQKKQKTSSLIVSKEGENDSSIWTEAPFKKNLKTLMINPEQ